MRIAHLSDIHVLDMSSARPWHFVGKRATGGANLWLKRGKSHSRQPVEQAFRDVREAGVDHIVVTGDLTNLALESEFSAARRIIEELGGDGDMVTVIPGNHDYYTLSSVLGGRFEHWFEPWMKDELNPGGSDSYPFVKLKPGLAIVGVSSCIASPPLMAVGRIGGAQLERLSAILAHEALKSRFVVVAVHHHLHAPKYNKAHKEWMRRMLDAEAMLTCVKTGRADLVIHGHNHQFGFTTLPRPDGGNLHISEAGSTSVAKYSNPHFGGKYKIYELEGSSDAPLRLTRVVTRLWNDDAAQFEDWHEQIVPNLSGGSHHSQATV